jgi:ketosteroid isomerase-like protein
MGRGRTSLVHGLEEETDMADHPNAALARQAMDNMNTGDWQAMSEFLDDNVVWHEIGRAEPRRGKAELMEATGPTSYYDIKAEVHDVVANDDHTIALVNATATRDGKTFEYRTAEIMHVRNGKVVERWAFSDDTAAIIEFFS